MRDREREREILVLNENTMTSNREGEREGGRRNGFNAKSITSVISGQNIKEH